ncbi:flagellar protein FliT [Ramlibacter sp. AN1133]|uniref:flagellar protein FliT n=1 Tax=Ramlibacter sp. AN1133 TaxID=3133429 RepID=UPI0030C5165E
MTGKDVLAFYTQLAATVARMVELARQLQWAQLPVLDARCTDLFVHLREADVPVGAFTAPERERLAALTLRIREDQQALAALLRPQFQHLVRMVESHAAR